jgi:ABC-type dipeptide/oligopeptide/nickel transport system permease subunit
MSANPETAQGFDPVDEVTYWSIVWGQFKKNRLAYWGLWMVLGLALLAIFAPALCLEIPFVYTAPDLVTGQVETTYPWFRTLLFDRNLFESAVDIFFNLLLALSPLVTAVSVVAWKMWRGRRRRDQLRLVRNYLLGWGAAILALFFLLLQAPQGQTFRDYVRETTEGRAAAEAEVHKLQQQGVSDEAKFAQLREQVPKAVFPPIPQSFRKIDLSESREPIGAAHLLGTDSRGRDVFARMLYGTRISLTIGVVAVSIYIVIGIILGALAGYFGGKVDMIVLRMVEVMLCFPSLVLIMTLAAFVEERTIFHVMLIIGLTGWTGPARLIRAEFLRLKNLDFVQAAIAAGLPQTRVIFGHVLPNAISPVLVSATFGIASAILVESTLSFLGLGDASAPSWGEILNLGRQDSEMRLILVPGMAIFFTVSLFNLVGEGVRDALDPKLRR